MQPIDKVKHASFIIFPASLVLLVLLGGFQSLPLSTLSIEAMRNVGNQQTRSQSLAKNAMIIGYIADQYVRSQAIGDIEVTLPLFEAGQTTMIGYRDRALQDIVAQTRSDYLAIDIAAKMVLSQAHGNVDKNQIAILLTHAHSYGSTMTQVTATLLQAVEDASQRLFFIEMVIDASLIIFLVVLAVIMRGARHAILPQAIYI
jgi:hypothetical protein